MNTPPRSSRSLPALALAAACVALLASCKEPVGIAEAAQAPAESAVAARLVPQAAVATGYTVDAMTIETRHWDSQAWVVMSSGIATWQRPLSAAQAVAAFDTLPRTVPGYTNGPIALPSLQCQDIAPGFAGTPPDFSDGYATSYAGCIQNPGDATGASHADVATRYRVRVTASKKIDAAIRFAVDAAGAVLLVDGVVVEAKWSDPFWNGYFDIDNGDVINGVYVPLWQTDTSSVMTASVRMNPGTTHLIELVGYENGADYGSSLQVDVGGGWVDAVSTVPAYTVPLTVSVGTGGGSVTSVPPGIDCGLACSAQFAWATTPELSATAAQYFVFGGWSGACTGTAGCAPLLETPKSVTATFTRVQWPLQVTLAGAGQGTVSSGNGAIDCGGGGSCEAGITVGASVSLTATPAANSDFAGWSGACSGTGACTVTMDQARSVTATFARNATGDVDPPVLSCRADPEVLSPANHKLVDVHVTVTFTDAGSGIDAFRLLSVQSNEPDGSGDPKTKDEKEQKAKGEKKDGTGDGNTLLDFQGWSVGTADVDGQLRAERAGNRDDRIYTLTYGGTDLAGNATISSCTVTVPHDKGKND